MTSEWEKERGKRGQETCIERGIGRRRVGRAGEGGGGAGRPEGQTIEGAANMHDR